MVSSSGRHRDAMPLQHQHIVFGVLADLEHGLVLEQRLQPLERRGRRHLLHAAVAEIEGTCGRAMA